MFRTKVTETREEILKAASMLSSSAEQNQYLRQSVINGEITPGDCHILIYNDEIVGQAVIFNDYYLGLYTLEDIEQENANEFLENILNKYPERKFRTDLYSDKKNYETVFSSLLANGFKHLIHKESYTINVTPVDRDSKLSFRPIASNEEELLVDLFIRAARDNKDSTVLKEIKEKGLENGSRDFFLELKEADFERDLWAIGWYNNDPAGFVIVQRLTDSDAGIGYIGVVPEYRGNHFSQDLLYKAINRSCQYGIKKLIADIDIENHPMRNNLLSCGFKLDCRETVLFRD